MNSIEMGQLAASAAIDKKGKRISLMDVRGLTDMCEVALVCSAENEKQSQAIADAIQERCKKVTGIKPFAVEGAQLGYWILLDYGNLVVHIFLATTRDYYAFDSLWPKAKILPADGAI
jgi:ribosome-associated protein